MAQKQKTVVYDLTARRIDELVRELQNARAQLADLEREIVELRAQRGGANADTQSFRTIRVPIVGTIEDGVITFKADPAFAVTAQRKGGAR